jgi:hypothetical protein
LDLQGPSGQRQGRAKRRVVPVAERSTVGPL